MSRLVDSWWCSALRSFAIELLIPLGAAAAAGLIVAARVTPAWTAPGLPYVEGFGKNVEAAAILAAVVVAAATRLACRWWIGRWLGLAMSLAGWVLLLTRIDLHRLHPAMPRLLFAGVLLLALVAASRAAPSSGARTRDDSTPRWLAALAVALLAGLEAMIAVDALQIDVFHHGEVLASAVDLLSGGKPFVTFVWPHGLHDTGLTALWILWTGKLGTSPVALARATVSGLGVVAAYVLCRRLSGGRWEALAGTLALTLVPMLVGPREASGSSPALASLGVLCWVAFAFARLSPATPARLCGAGILLGVGHLFRFETAVYGALAAAASVAATLLTDVERPLRDRARGLVLAAVGLTGGFVLPLLASRLLWGWPDAAWVEYLAGDLARHHRDAVGLVLRWPLKGAQIGAENPTTLAAALAWLLFVVGLAAVAAGALAARLRRPASAAGARAPELVFLATFALAASRSAFDRLDAPHVLQWAALPILGTLLLLSDLWRGRPGWSTARSAAATALLLAVADPARLAPGNLQPLAPAGVLARIAGGAIRTREHLAPNAPAGACADRSFTASELLKPENRRLVDATCDVERWLRAHRVRGLAIADSAPWYWVRFGMGAPYREFSLSRAYTPAAQRRWIRELRANPPEALLLPRGFRALRELDVPVAVRNPVAEAYLRGRRAGTRAWASGIGDLFAWNEPGPCPPASAGDAPSSAAELIVETLYLEPATGRFFARGRARETITGAPLAALSFAAGAPIRWGAVDYGLSAGPREPIGAPVVGWEASGLLAGATPPDRLVLEGRLGDGRTVRLEAAPVETIRLPPLTDAAWRDLADLIAEAWEVGLADRRASSGVPCAP